MSKIAGCNSPMRSMKCGAVSRGATSSTRKNISTGSNVRLRELGDGDADCARLAQIRAARIVRRNRVENGLIYLQITRGTLRRDHPIPAIRPSRP
jgi:hypothetical protein